MASDLKEAGGLTRLFVTAALEPGAAVILDEGQTHYLLHVLRAGAGDEDAASPASSNRAGASSGQGATAASEDSEDTSIPCAGEALG